MKRLRIALAALLVAAFVLPSMLHFPDTVALAEVAGNRAEIGSWGFDTAGMEQGVKPGDDFVRYANGTYIETLEIPADRAEYGMFSKLHDLSQERTREIIEGVATNPTGSAAAVKVGTFYSTFMDEAAIEAKGTQPLQAMLAPIAKIASISDLSRYLGVANTISVNTPFEADVAQDLKDVNRMSVYLGQGGLGMPDRDYYLDTKNEKFVETAAKYRANIATQLKLAGITDADAKAQQIFDLEKKIAEVHWTNVEQRQIDKLYNLYAAADLPKQFPGVDWQQFREGARISREKQVIVTNPSAFVGMAKLVASEPLQTWKDYLTYHAINRAAPALPKAFVDARFSFYGTVLSGAPEIQPRWKRGVNLTNNLLGEAVGELYVAKYFTPEAKAKADTLVKNLIAAMDERLANLDWMEAKTKAAARDKLASFTAKIGYPEQWRDYSAFDVKAGDALGNMLRGDTFEYQRNVDKLGKPIDRSEWGMAPMVVNAYANPLWNEIVFPAAILQPPFFDPNADPAVNYGGIGAVIGHEISHHFDDQGRKFDKTGALTDWWTEADVKRFQALTDKVVAQYATYEPLPGKNVNGELTLGENIADLAGLTVAYDAYQRSLGGKPAPVIDGVTGDQRFFLGFAQVWRQKYRDPALLQSLTVGPHTPGHFRPYVVRNLDAWYKAFNVKPGDKLYLSEKDRARVW